MSSVTGNIERTYRSLCLEAVFSDQPLDICFETPLAGEESPCVVGSVDDDPRAAIYASLFAAAPKLLAELKDAVQNCPCSVLERDSGHRVGCNAPCWQAAIDEAEGRSDD